MEYVRAYTRRISWERSTIDITKALALGARGVLVSRPLMWGLAAYGADGVRAVIELLQSDVARNMGALGAPSLTQLNRSMVRVHRR
jgi:4-hydroxymandelate oxidase